MIFMMKKGIFASMALSFLLCSCITQQNTDEWPMFMHDPQHTSYSSSHIPDSLYLLWEYKKPDNVLTYVIISNKKVIAAFKSCYVSCLDMTDGSLLWETTESFEGFPAADKTRAYTGLIDGIFCFDISTGGTLWEYEEFLAIMGSPPIVIDEHLFVGSASEFVTFIDVWDPSIDPSEKLRRMLCFNTTNGEVIWVFCGKDSIIDSPAYYDGNVFINDSESIYSLDAQTGDIIWEKEMKGASYVSLSQDGKRIFVVSLGEIPIPVSEMDRIT